jgi:hypothetical protein
LINNYKKRLGLVFVVHVSNWIYDLMTEGKVEVYIKLIKQKDKRIKYLYQKIPTLKNDDSKFGVYLAIDSSKRISNNN